MVIMAVLALAVSPSFFGRDSTTIPTTRNNIIMAFSQAQQIAMAQGEASVIINSNSVDVQVNGTTIHWPGTTYPYPFPSGITVTQGSWMFDKLGRTSAGGVVINGQLTITVEASGYAY